MICSLEDFSLFSRYLDKPNRYQRLCLMFLRSIVDRLQSTVFTTLLSKRVFGRSSSINLSGQVLPISNTAYIKYLEMLRPLDIPITKFAQNQMEKFNKQSPDKTSSPPSSSRSPDTSSNSLLLQPSSIIKNKSSRAQAALFLRNSIRCLLRKHFKQMLSRLMLRKICFRLITSRRKRDIELSFLAIRAHANQLAQGIMHRFYERHPQVRIMSSICNKILAKPERDAINKIRAHSLRRKRVQNFVTVLGRRYEQALFRQAARIIWAAFGMTNARNKQYLTGADAIYRWASLRKRTLVELSFIKITDVILLTDCESNLESKKSKQQQLTTNVTNRKQTITKLRQQIKATKTLLDQQKLARHKVFQEHKKYVQTNKLEMGQAVRKYEKEKKVEEAIYNQIQSQLKQWQRILQIRQDIANSGIGSESRCFQIYSTLHRQQTNIIRAVEPVVPEVEKHTQKFKEGQDYYFQKNIRMAKLIELYEKRQAYNYQPQYYELQYQNKVIKETIRCFIRERYEAFMSKHRRRQRANPNEQN